MTQRRYYIGPEGPKTARLAIVAEKPGPDELHGLQSTGHGRPLIGASGKAVDRHLLNIGTHRSNVYLTNAVKHFDTLGTPSIEDVKAEQMALYRELHSLPNLNCVVAMGRTALVSLSNFWHEDIGRRRGSILKSFTGLKMIPTWHPSFYFRGEWRFRSVVEFDLKRALEESQTHNINLPERTYYIEPSYSEAKEWLLNLIGAKQISYDIETFRRQFISCIAFSDDPARAYCIPFWRGPRPYWPQLWEEAAVWRLIQQVFDQPGTEYIGQNTLFDSWHLWRYGIRTDRMGTQGFDTMYAHRLIAPDLPHSLAFLTSIYTREPFYKDESGRWDSEVRVPDQQFWTYNSKDAAVTLEIARAEQEDMEEL